MRRVFRSVDWWIALGLVTAVIAVYAQTRSFDFINFDDGEYVTNNPYLRGGWSSIGWAERDRARRIVFLICAKLKAAGDRNHQ